MLRKKKGAMLMSATTIIFILGAIVLVSLVIWWINGTGESNKTIDGIKDITQTNFNATKSSLQDMLNTTTDSKINSVQSDQNKDNLVPQDKLKNVNIKTELDSYEIKKGKIEGYEDKNYLAIMQTVGETYYALIKPIFDDKEKNILKLDKKSNLWKVVEDKGELEKYFSKVIDFKSKADGGVCVGQTKEQMKNNCYNDVPIENVDGISVAHLPTKECNKAMWVVVPPDGGYWGLVPGKIANCFNHEDKGSSDNLE
jgi:hypothetical protein